MPYVKSCSVSGLDSSLDSSKTPINIWVLDGMNNEGFSGGPVTWGTGLDLKVTAVISGRILEPAEVVHSSPPPSPTAPPANRKAKQAPATQSNDTANVNAGFIIAYDIHFAMDAIHQHPIGALRQANGAK
jgi:hypothetical protein